jgi:hypothetical protein
MSVPPLHLVELSDNAEEIRIWIGFGIIVPDVLLRITTGDDRTRGELVYWWDSTEHPAQDTAFSPVLSEIRRLAGRNGCNEANTGMEWSEHRDGAVIEHREWVFACKIDLGHEGPNWDSTRARLMDLRAFDLPDPKSLQPTGIIVLDGTSIEVEVLKGAHYHTYTYGNPARQPWPEAKFAQSIIEFVHGLIENLDRP